MYELTEKISMEFKRMDWIHLLTILKKHPGVSRCENLKAMRESIEKHLIIPKIEGKLSQ